MLMKVSLGACTNSQTAKNPGAQLTFSFSFLTSRCNDIIWEERSNLSYHKAKGLLVTCTNLPWALDVSSYFSVPKYQKFKALGNQNCSSPFCSGLYRLHRETPEHNSGVWKVEGTNHFVKKCRRPKLLSNSVKPFKPCQLGFSCTLAGTRSPTTCPTTSVEPFRPSMPWSNRVRNTNMLTSNSLN